MSKIVILGAGESGAGAAVLAKKEGFEVFVSDMSKIKDNYKKLMDDHNIEWEEGHHTEENILDADEVIKSPGIPKEAPMIQKLMAKGTPIISEIEFAGRYTDAKMICITGSNGKTTTTSLIYHIIKSAGYDVGLAGNIGKSLALQVAETPHKYYVIELSSFQLDNMYEFRANVAILLNITPDHLDRYEFKMQNYTDAKMRITQNQTEEDSFIFWNDDPIVTKELAKYNLKSHLCPFSEFKEEGCVGFIEDGKYKLNFPSDFEMPQADMSLRGKHNIYNSLAAGLACNIVGITQNQTEEDSFIFWNDDPIVTKELAKYNLKSHLCPFSEFKEEGCVGFIEDGKYKLNFPSDFEMPQADMSLRGKHNIYNSLAAGLACNIVGIDHETLHKGLSDFPGVEHRLEKVGKFQGVYYVNDSKATNVDACWYALESMTTPTILIIGGKDKGNDYNQIKDLVKEKCAGIVYLGADNQKLHDNFDALGIPVRDTHSMKDCVAACQELAKPGDTVLLSPCCASFDLFKNMEDRGEQFKTLARAIGE